MWPVLRAKKRTVDALCMKNRTEIVNLIIRLRLSKIFERAVIAESVDSFRPAKKVAQGYLGVKSQELLRKPEIQEIVREQISKF